MREPLLTDRLVLRDITEADAEWLFDLDSDPEVMRYIGPRPASDPAAYCDRTRAVHLPYQVHPWHGVRIVLDRAGGAFLGWVFVRPAMASKFAPELGWTRRGGSRLPLPPVRVGSRVGDRGGHAARADRARGLGDGGGGRVRPGGQRGFAPRAGETRPGACRRSVLIRDEGDDGEARSCEMTPQPAGSGPTRSDEHGISERTCES